MYLLQKKGSIVLFVVSDSLLCVCVCVCVCVCLVCVCVCVCVCVWLVGVVCEDARGEGDGKSSEVNA